MSNDVALRPTAHGKEARVRRLAPVLAALLFLIAQLFLLGTTLGDIDAYNFALGVRDYDPALHQPHPPGYPLYIGLAKLSTWALDALRPEGTHPLLAGQLNAAQGLAIWSAVGGAAAVLLLPVVFASLMAWRGRRLPPRTSWVVLGATLLTVTCPLFWFSSARPLSDIPGLAAALLAQAAVLLVLQRGSLGPLPRWHLAGATFVTALVIGIRSQAMWLTIPLLLFVAIASRRAVPRGGWWRAAGAGLLGLLLWAVPMIAASGGPWSYLAALGGQGAEDFSGVDMFYRNPTPVRLAQGLVHTFTWPWASDPLATVVLALAVLGAGWLLFAAPRAMLLCLVAFGPYAIFHLLFHETITIRYALPLVPPVAWLSAAGLVLAARRLAVPLVFCLALWGLGVAWPATAGYRQAGSPVSRLLHDVADRAEAIGKRPAIGMHYEMRRAALWGLSDGGSWPHRLACGPGDGVRCVLQYLEAGGEAPIWFLANPRRTDLAAIDRRAVREVARYGWSFDKVVLTGNTRPSEAAWLEVSTPGWFVGEGWALNPEIAGLSSARGKGPSAAPIGARILRRAGPAVAVVGGRHLGGAASPPARVDVALDGRPLLSFDVTPERPFFLHTTDLPPGSLLGEGRFASLTIAAHGGGPVAIEQFDLQDAGQVVFGFGDGWHEAEHDPRRGLSWRWASDSARLHVRDGGGDVEVWIAAESPRRYFDRAPLVTLSAGAEVLAQLRPENDFSMRARLSPDALARSNGIVTLSTDAAYVPAERGENADRRRLGLRVYSVAVDRVPAEAPRPHVAAR